MNQKDTAKVRSVQRKAEVCNNTTSYRVALVSMNPRTNRLEAHGDKGINNLSLEIETRYWLYHQVKMV